MTQWWKLGVMWPSFATNLYTRSGAIHLHIMICLSLTLTISFKSFALKSFGDNSVILKTTTE